MKHSLVTLTLLTLLTLTLTLILPRPTEGRVHRPHQKARGQAHDKTYGHIQDAMGSLMGVVSGRGKDRAGGCVFSCPAGQSPAAKEGHIPVSNGCGTGQMKLPETVVDFTPCCDVHDVCYHTCGSDRHACDVDFAECMDAACHAGGLAKDRLATCHSQAKMYGLGVSLGGCPPFLESQKDACHCQRDDL